MARTSSFTERFAELLDRSSKPDVSIANALGVSKQTISAWKTGVRSPKNPMIVRIADLFGVDISWLMGFDAELEKVSALFRKNVGITLSSYDPSDILAAEEAGNNVALVYRVAEGTGPITLDTANEVAEILGTTVGELLEEENRFAASSKSTPEFVQLFSALTSDMQVATLAAMKAFLSAQESSSAEQEKV